MTGLWSDLLQTTRSTERPANVQPRCPCATNCVAAMCRLKELGTTIKAPTLNILQQRGEVGLRPSTRQALVFVVVAASHGDRTRCHLRRRVRLTFSQSVLHELPIFRFDSGVSMNATLSSAESNSVNCSTCAETIPLSTRLALSMAAGEDRASSSYLITGS